MMISILKSRAEAELEMLAHDPYCALYLPLWKQDVAQSQYFYSADAHATRFYTSNSSWTPLGRHTTKNGEQASTPDHEAVLDIADAITLEIYMKLDAREAGKYPRIVSHKYEYSYDIHLSSGGVPAIGIMTAGGSGGVDSQYSSQAVPLNRFTLVTSTYDSSDNTLRNYQDGLFINSKTHGYGGKIDIHPYTFYVGNMIGYTAFVFVYSRALTPPEIEHHGRVARRLFP